MESLNRRRVEIYNLLSRPSGAFAMVAIDQRESLREMFTSVVEIKISDELLIKFKSSVAEILSPYASAMLFDRYYGLSGMEVARSINPSCGIVIAADHLIQEPGQVVTDTRVDYLVNPRDMLTKGARALKFMLIWRGEENAEHCIQLAEEFLAFSRVAGLLGIVETIVRKPLNNSDKWDREKELIKAANVIGELKPDLYKTEVPFLGKANLSVISRYSELITSALPCPWVVLSSGVSADRFPEAVKASCEGGASGFLAGRGIWKDAISADENEYRKNLQYISIDRLLTLGEIVDKSARPWREVL